MLQQTQVDRVIPFFEAFVERFPTFNALAAASRGDVIRLWAGLGYNRRAVHLHSLARVVVDEHGGRLPADPAALRRLPGIGPYTVGAILSIAFGRPEPAMDTNVRRVIGRYYSVSPLSAAELEVAARGLLPNDRAGDWNQALMDLGSAVCLGRRPRCLMCPLRQGCASAGLASTGSNRRLPARLGREDGATAFVGTTRYFRGRLLAQLRELPAGERAHLPEIAAQLAARGVAEPPAGWAAIGQALARDGLVRVEWTHTGIALEID
jgi:A/G-specific adenine glycosylase